MWEDKKQQGDTGGNMPPKTTTEKRDGASRPFCFSNEGIEDLKEISYIKIMKKVLLTLGLFVALNGIGQSIPNFPGSSSYVKFPSPDLPDGVEGKFVCTVVDSLKNPNYDYFGADKFYINIQRQSKEDLKAIVSELMSILEFYDTKLGGNISVSYFEPTEIIVQEGGYFCYDDLFDEEYFSEHKTLNYDKVWQDLSLCMFNSYVSYEIVNKELKVEFFCNHHYVGLIVVKK